MLICRFFFQAEDGIRDFHVTGVQTCALPISALHVFGTVQNQLVPADQISDLAFGRKGASWLTPENTQAAQRVAEWAQAGYFNEEIGRASRRAGAQSCGDDGAAEQTSETWVGA